MGDTVTFPILQLIKAQVVRSLAIEVSEGLDQVTATFLAPRHYVTFLEWSTDQVAWHQFDEFPTTSLTQALATGLDLPAETLLYVRARHGRSASHPTQRYTTVSATTPINPRPDAPTGLVVNGAYSEENTLDPTTQATVQWTDPPGDDLIELRVYLSDGEDNFVLKDTVAPGQQNALISGLDNTVVYSEWGVAAVNAGGEGPMVTLDVPTPPNTFSGEPFSSTEIHYSFGAALTPSGGWLLVNQSDGATVATPAQGSGTYIDTGLTGGTTYNRWIMAVDTNGNTSLAMANSTPTLLPAPANLQATDGGDGTFSASCDALAGANQYQFYVDGTGLGWQAGNSVSSVAEPDGGYTITVRARTALNVEGELSAGVDVTVTS